MRIGGEEVSVAQRGHVGERTDDDEREAQQRQAKINGEDIRERDGDEQGENPGGDAEENRERAELEKMADREADEQRVAGVKAGVEKRFAEADEACERVGREHRDDAGEAEARVQQRDAEQRRADEAALEEEDLRVAAKDGVGKGFHAGRRRVIRSGGKSPRSARGSSVPEGRQRKLAGGKRGTSAAPGGPCSLGSCPGGASGEKSLRNGNRDSFGTPPGCGYLSVANRGRRSCLAGPRLIFSDAPPGRIGEEEWFEPRHFDSCKRKGSAESMQ